MEFVAPNWSSTLVFVLILVFILGAFLRAVSLSFGSTKKVALGLTLWLGIFSALVSLGFIPLIMAFSILSALALSFSPLGAALSTGIALGPLVAFQGFRLILELVLHSWAKQGSIPYSMTWEGANFDIVSGISAIVLAPFVLRNSRLAWIANIIGSIFLLNVMRVAVMSSPFPFAWNVEPPLQVALYLPYAYIVPICVGGALAGHVILTRALLKK